ncbi:Uncharacterized protein PBTT_04492 [Plasmodiophora brassicae]|nr:hypothetical protein PBRA_007995 [Plasmodiophora brassicae]
MSVLRGLPRVATRLAGLAYQRPVLSQTLGACVARRTVVDPLRLPPEMRGEHPPPADDSEFEESLNVPDDFVLTADNAKEFCSTSGKRRLTIRQLGLLASQIMERLEAHNRKVADALKCMLDIYEDATTNQVLIVARERQTEWKRHVILQFGTKMLAAERNFCPKECFNDMVLVFAETAATFASNTDHIIKIFCPRVPLIGAELQPQCTVADRYFVKLGDKDVGVRVILKTAEAEWERSPHFTIRLTDRHVRCPQLLTVIHDMVTKAEARDLIVRQMRRRNRARRKMLILDPETDSSDVKE